MFWKVTFQCDPAYAIKLGNALEDHVSSVSWFETKDPEPWVVEAVTLSKPDEKAFISLLTPVYESLGISVPPLTIEPLPETDWLEATWRNFPPRQIGRYYVYGSHTSPNPPPDAITLEINAATAFGSGEHETTTGCLLTLDDLASQGILFQKPLDMGCGSGILAMAIAKTWAIPVMAADNDPESVKVTTNNAILNHCASLITAIQSEGFNSPDVQTQGPYDLIVANILATPLIEMAEALGKSLAPQGLVILSGLLSRQKDDVVHAYATQGMHMVSHQTLNDWEALLLKKAE